MYIAPLITLKHHCCHNIPGKNVNSHHDANVVMMLYESEIHVGLFIPPTYMWIHHGVLQKNTTDVWMRLEKEEPGWDIVLIRFFDGLLTPRSQRRG